jgi:hypothetical protein
MAVFGLASRAVVEAYVKDGGTLPSTPRWDGRIDIVVAHLASVASRVPYEYFSARLTGSLAA